MSRRASLRLWRRAERRGRDGVAAYSGWSWLFCPRGPCRCAAWRACGLSLGGRGACFIHISREARTRLTRKGWEKGGMSRPGAPDSPCSGGRKRRRKRSDQRIRGASCLRMLTVNRANGNLSRGRSPWPTPGRPAGLRVLAHTHDNLYPSTSSTPSASHTGRRRYSRRAFYALCQEWITLPGSRLLTAVSRPSATHTGRADRRKRTSYITISLSCTNDITVKLQRRLSQDFSPVAPDQRWLDMASAPNQITLAQGAMRSRDRWGD